MERKAIEEQKEAQNAEYLSACGDFPKYKFSEDEDRYLICRKRFDDGECLMIHISVGGIDGDLYSIYDMERNDIYDYPTIFLGERDEVCAATTPEYFNSKLK